MGGILAMIILVILGLLQDYRLDGIETEMGQPPRLRPGALGRLFLPLPLIVLLGYLANDAVGSETWNDQADVHQAIQRVYYYDGDLFSLYRSEGGINYNALRGVRDRLSLDYTVRVVDAQVSDTNPLRTLTVHFADGFWMNCQFLGDVLNFCYDASPPFTTGLAEVIAGVPVDENCRNCQPRVDETWTAWLRARADQLGDQPQISREAQWGNYTLMAARSADGDFGLVCRFRAVRPAYLEECWEESE
jgi:hypothetical protein